MITQLRKLGAQCDFSKFVASDQLHYAASHIRKIIICCILLIVFYRIWSDVKHPAKLTKFYTTLGEKQQTTDTSMGLKHLNGTPFHPFRSELWHTFYRFVDPETQNVHRNATWFALSLLTESFDQIDPTVRNEELEDKLSMQLQQENISIEMGGYYSPNGKIDLHNCSVINQILVILIPYRNRAHNLISFLSYMHRYLPLKSVQYRVVLLEQTSYKSFNRAKLFNAGLRELGLLITEGKRPFVEDNSTRSNCTNQCFILHDVDKLPISMHTPYECHDNPWQLDRIAVALNNSVEKVGNLPLHRETKEHRLYESFFGGVSMVNKRVLLLVNGLSNTFYGWGGEDDDLRSRMRRRHVRVHLTPLNHSRFYYMDHAKDSPRNSRASMLLSDNRVWTRMQRDGIRQVRYTVRDRIVRPLYTLYKISV